jgi:hypothetical protein
MQSLIPAGATSSWWLDWDWKDGSLNHPVPKDWRFPKSLSVKQIWDLWFFGHRSDRIRPYRHIHRYADISVNSDRRLYSAAKIVIENFGKYILRRNNEFNFRNMTPESSDANFFTNYSSFLDEIYSQCNRQCVRKDDLSYGTLYSVILKNKN